MVHGNHVYDGARKSLFQSNFLAVFHMGDDHEPGHFWRQAIMDILSTLHILYEIAGFVHLANIVIESTHPTEQSICANTVCGLFCELTHHQGVLKGARCEKRKLIQERSVGIAQFHEANLCQYIEPALQEWQRTGNQYPRYDSSNKTPSRILERNRKC